MPPSPSEAAFSELEASVGPALETYSNVHRGTGYNSMASTLLYEQARNAVLNICGLDKGRHTVVFCSPARAAALEAAVRPGRTIILSSRALGLPLGLRAVIVNSSALPRASRSSRAAARSGSSRINRSFGKTRRTVSRPGLLPS